MICRSEEMKSDGLVHCLFRQFFSCLGERERERESDANRSCPDQMAIDFFSVAEQGRVLLTSSTENERTERENVSSLSSLVDRLFRKKLNQRFTLH